MKLAGTAIVLAAFGASSVSALKGIDGVYRAVRDAFRGVMVQVCFTSNRLRALWQAQVADGQVEGLMEWMIPVRGVLGTMAWLVEQGWQIQIVQPLHITAAEEYHDLKAYVRALAGIRTLKPRWRPFRCVALGRPALGEPGPRRDYLADLQRAARALEEDVQMAQADGAALVYVGHGNRYWPGGVFMEFEHVLRATYPGTGIFVGTVEGLVGPGEVARQVATQGFKRVHMRPLMVVAGVHAREDIDSGQKGSWRWWLERMGLEVRFFERGLGELRQWAAIYVEHLRDAAADAGIDL